METATVPDPADPVVEEEIPPPPPPVAKMETNPNTMTTKTQVARQIPEMDTFAIFMIRPSMV
jgi:hypothetical protein